MRRYLLKRVITGLLMVIISVGINFALVRLAPGDPMVMLAGVDNPNPAQVEALTKKFGLDKSIPEQFIIFLILNNGIIFLFRRITRSES